MSAPSAFAREVLGLVSDSKSGLLETYVSNSGQTLNGRSARLLIKRGPHWYKLPNEEEAGRGIEQAERNAFRRSQ